MAFLDKITFALRGHSCQRIVKQIGNEIHINGASVGISDFKIDTGELSNKIKEFYKVTQTTVSMDNTQYLLCTSIFQMNLSEKLKEKCNQIRLQIIIGYNQLESYLATLDQDPTDGTREKLLEWQDYMEQISKGAIESLQPQSQTHQSFIKQQEDTVSHAKPKRIRSTKKVSEKDSHTVELEAKINELEAKLANLSSQTKPISQPTPYQDPSKPRPAASGPTHGTLPAGMKPAPKPEATPEPNAHEPLVGEVAPAYAKISSTGYTGNKYFATRKRLSYHPADKQFTGSSSTSKYVPPPPPQMTPELKSPRSTLPAEMKPTPPQAPLSQDTFENLLFRTMKFQGIDANEMEKALKTLSK